jgi:hypothetical protein
VQCGEGDGACLGAYNHPLANFGESVAGAYPIGVLVGPIDSLVKARRCCGVVVGALCLAAILERLAWLVRNVFDSFSSLVIILDCSVNLN